MNYALHVLGAGAAQAVELGSSGAVLERDGEPLLLIDCGPDTLSRYLDAYGAPPRALYITHVHMDHVAGLERLFYRAWFDEALRGTIRLYAHAALVPLLQSRVADYPNVVAEGGANFWDAYRLVALSRGFWQQGLWFDVFPTRHHAPNTSFGVALGGCFAWTGDTRPVPEMLAAHAGGNTLVAHDCALRGNASHTGLDDLQREYPDELRARLLLYHYGSARDGRALVERGYRIAEPGMRYPLHEPDPVRADAG
ncbi:MAG: MBL fold metallo-hydrolase [Rhodanobacteraceae bacterium]